MAQFILRHDLHAVAVLLQLGKESHGGPGTSAIDELPVLAPSFRTLNHRQDRGDANTTGNEQVVVRLGEAEVIAGPGDGDGGTVDKRVVDRRRPAAAGDLAQHADPVGGGVGWIAAQGVLAHNVAGQVQIDVRAGLPGGQLAAVGVHQRQGDHAVGLGRALVDDQLQRPHGGVLGPFDIRQVPGDVQ